MNNNNNNNSNNNNNNNIYECSICAHPLCTSEKCINKILNNKNLTNNNKNQIRKIKLDKIFINSCKHKFHKSCIIKWLNVKKNNVCPYCRGPIDLKETNLVFFKLTENNNNFNNNKKFNYNKFLNYIKSLNDNLLLGEYDNGNNLLIILLKYYLNYNIIDSIKYLIEKRIDINHTNNYNNTPLSISYNTQNYNVLKLLIENNANININIDETPFTIELLKKFSVIKNNINNREKILLREIINMCFDKIENIDITDPNGYTLLMIIDIFLSDDIYFNKYFDKIIDKGANLNIKDKDGYTILMWLVENEDILIIKKLLNNPNIDINLKNKNGDTALDIAIKKKNKDFINLLLNNDRLIKTSKSLNNSILTKNINIVKLLINKNFPINNLNKYINNNEFNKEYKNKIIKIKNNFKKLSKLNLITKINM